MNREKVYVSWPCHMYRLDGGKSRIPTPDRRGPICLAIIGCLVVAASFLMGIAVGIGMR